MAALKIDAGLRGIMVTDIVGSTELTARLGDVRALELVRVHDALMRWRRLCAPPPTFSVGFINATLKRSKV
jgi:hypothetical protein